MCVYQRVYLCARVSVCVCVSARMCTSAGSSSSSWACSSSHLPSEVLGRDGANYFWLCSLLPRTARRRRWKRPGKPGRRAGLPLPAALHPSSCGPFPTAPRSGHIQAAIPTLVEPTSCPALPPQRCQHQLAGALTSDISDIWVPPCSGLSRFEV